MKQIALPHKNKNKKVTLPLQTIGVMMFGMAGSFALDIVLRGAWPLGYLPPLFVLFAMALFWRLPLWFGVSVALGAGMIADVISFLPFGTYIFILSFAAVLPHALRQSSIGASINRTTRILYGAGVMAACGLVIAAVAAF